jgi:protein-L-isoaspartate(D-aspartate) O-methyltransferase
MVEKQLRARGIKDDRVLRAMREVPRHEFVPEEFRSAAYEDRPLPIGERETISQPYIIGLITEAACGAAGCKALEIGSGSGYQAALLAHLGMKVVAIETNPRLAEESRARLEGLGYQNVKVIAGDGSEGYAAEAPYETIIVSAGAPRVSPALLDQLQNGGRLVAPVGNLSQQDLILITRRGQQITMRRLGACQFVPLIGKGGWKEPHIRS